jgi:hypothetical protein
MHITQDNYLLWEVQRAHDLRLAYETLAQSCLNEGASRNFTYAVPLVTTAEALTNDTTLLFCARVMDDFWWFDYYYNQSLNITTSGPYESLHYEIADYYLPKLESNYQNYILHGLNNATYLTAQQVWNYTNRTLTYYPEPNLTAVTGRLDSMNATIASIKNDTATTRSWVQQIWTWVQGIFNWTSAQPSYPQSVAFLPSQYYVDEPASVVAQVLVNGAGVSAAGCTLNVYYPNMTKQVNAAAMNFTGDDGLYSYLWTPPSYGSFPVRANCSGGSVTGQISGAASLGVSAPSAYANIQMVS